MYEADFCDINRKIASDFYVEGQYQTSANVVCGEWKISRNHWF